MKNEKKVPSRLGPAVSTSAAAAPATTPASGQLGGVGRLQLRGPRRGCAALGVADDRRRAVVGQLRRGRSARAARIESSTFGPSARPDHVGVVTRGPEALVVGDRNRPAAGQDHRHQSGLPLEPAGAAAATARRVADAVGADRVADQRTDPRRRRRGGSRSCRRRPWARRPRRSSDTGPARLARAAERPARDRRPSARPG